jgi:hypothetical protein
MTGLCEVYMMGRASSPAMPRMVYWVSSTMRVLNSGSSLFMLMQQHLRRLSESQLRFFSRESHGQFASGLHFGKTMKPLRLTNPSITKSLGYRIYMDRNRLLNSEIAKRITEHENNVAMELQTFIASVQSKLNEVNGRASAQTISDAKVLFDIAIGIEVELRVRGVSIKNIKGTKVHFVPKSGFKIATTSVDLERCATGWFTTKIERTITGNGKHTVSITPQAAADIINSKVSIGVGNFTVDLADRLG